MDTLIEPARPLPVLARFDVLVCGGGPAGCAAAVTAGRLGARTLLIERDGFLGGMTTAGLVSVILSSNGRDLQGIWHDWIRAVRRYDGVSDLTRGEKRGYDTHWLVASLDSESVKMAWDDLLDEAGVQLLHHVLVAGAWVEDGRIKGVIVETKNGRQVILAERVIDATGDADVCAHAGVGYDKGAFGKPWAMGVGIMWRYGGVPVPKDYIPGRLNPLGKTGRSAGPRPLFIGGLLRQLKVDPTDPWDLTRASRDGRREIWAKWRSKITEEGMQDVFISDTPARPGVRSSRRVHGLATVTEDDCWHYRKHPLSIARSSWEIDIHSPEDPRTKGVAFDDPKYVARSEKSKAGEYFDIPYGCVVAKGVDNLLMAGRCISAEHVAQSSLRIQQTCQALGQAAGTAAALSLREGTTPRAIDPRQVIDQLDRDRAATVPAFDVLRDPDRALAAIG